MLDIDSDLEKVNVCRAGSQQASTSSNDDSSAQILTNQKILSQFISSLRDLISWKMVQNVRKRQIRQKLKAKVIPAAPRLKRQNNLSQKDHKEW